MEIHLQITGWMLICLAISHLWFPKYFKWENDLPKMSLINRDMFKMHVLFIALLLVFVGVIQVLYPSELVHSKLGRALSCGWLIFWGTRLVVQFIGYSPKIWLHNRFKTVMHVIFSCFWLYLGVINYLIVFT